VSSPFRSHFAAVVFDFDGVLVESLDIKTRAFAELYQPHGEAIVMQVVAFHKAHGGVSRFDKIRHFEHVLLGHPIVDDEIQDKAGEFARLVEEAVIACPEVAGATELLRLLSGQLPCFVASATPEAELRRIVYRRGWNDMFSGIFGTPATKKEILLNILHTTRKPADECLMVGDAMTDFEAARQSGLTFVGRVPVLTASPFPSGVPSVKDMHELLQMLPTLGGIASPD
jgi:phosphoglycolate phosphatase-like HAD superfamily hydrolase